MVSVVDVRDGLPLIAVQYYYNSTVFTDGSLKSWEGDTGHGVSTLPSTHKGWITQLIYWLDSCTHLHAVILQLSVYFIIKLFNYGRCIF